METVKIAKASDGKANLKETVQTTSFNTFPPQLYDGNVLTITYKEQP